MLEQILVEYRGHLVALLVALIGALVAVFLHRHNRRNIAADKFRGALLKEWQGLVPINGYWAREEYPRFQQAIPVVKRAALEYRPVIPFYRKRAFDEAVINYCEQSQSMNWDQAAADAFYGSETEVTQKEAFTKCAYHLLSFSD